MRGDRLRPRVPARHTTVTRRIALAQLALLVVILAARSSRWGWPPPTTSTPTPPLPPAPPGPWPPSPRRTWTTTGPTRQLPAGLARAVRGGDGAYVVARDGTVLAGAGQPGAAGRLLRQALAGQPATQWHGEGAGRLLAVAVPVGDQNPPVGAVLLVRPAQPLDQTVHRLWLRLAGLAVAAALAAAAVAVALSRWAGQPVRRLECVAHAFGPADLQTGADAAGGPAEVRRLAAAFNATAGRLQNTGPRPSNGDRRCVPPAPHAAGRHPAAPGAARRRSSRQPRRRRGDRRARRAGPTVPAGRRHARNRPRREHRPPRRTDTSRPDRRRTRSKRGGRSPTRPRSG